MALRLCDSLAMRRAERSCATGTIRKARSCLAQTALSDFNDLNRAELGPQVADGSNMPSHARTQLSSRALRAVPLWLGALLAACGSQAAPEAVPEPLDDEPALLGPGPLGANASDSPITPHNDGAGAAPVLDALTTPALPEDSETDAPLDFNPVAAACENQVDCPWSARADLPMASRGHAAAISNGLIYVFGGMTTAEVASTNASPAKREALGIALPTTFYGQVRAYDPSANLWVPRATMPVGLYSSTAHAIGDAIYVVGGYGEQGFTGALQRYTPATDTWDALSPRPLQRYTFVSEAIGGRVYVTGGVGPEENPTPDRELTWDGKTRLEIYDTATDTWSDGTPAPLALADAASCAAAGRMFLFGGELANATLIYDTATDSWSQGTPPPTLREGQSCARIGDSMFVLGGRDPVTGVELDLIERYDVATDTWNVAERLPTPRFWFTSIALANEIYSIGGERLMSGNLANDFGMLGSVEVLRVAP
jgi:N-acetylneuraminic acid mutarotase